MTDNSVQIKGFGITRERLSEQVANHIQGLVLEGELNPGDRLPSERKLSEQFGVSRTVAREAIKLLEERSLVKVVSGSGTYISIVDPELVKQSIGLYMSGQKNSFQDMLEIRLFFEVNIAGLAAKRAAKKDIKSLEKAIEDMRSALPDILDDRNKLEQFVQADLRFHWILAKSTKNSLLPVLLSALTNLLLEFSRQASSKPGAGNKAIEFHERILDFIRKRDVEGARNEMRSHMSSAEEYTKR